MPNILQDKNPLTYISLFSWESLGTVPLIIMIVRTDDY